jgi:hypothetical protein
MNDTREILDERSDLERACIELVTALEVACIKRDQQMSVPTYGGLDGYDNDRVMTEVENSRFRQSCNRKFATTSIRGFGYQLDFQPISPFTGYGFVDICINEAVHRIVFGDGGPEIPQDGDITADVWKRVLLPLPCSASGFIDKTIDFNKFGLSQDDFIRVLVDLYENPGLLAGGRRDVDMNDSNEYLKGVLDEILHGLGYDTRGRLKRELDKTRKSVDSLSSSLDGSTSRASKAERSANDSSSALEIARQRIDSLQNMVLLPVSRRVKIGVVCVLAYVGVFFGMKPACEWWNERQNPSSFVSADRDLDTMGIPDDMSDSMAIFMASVPTYGPKATVKDTLLSPHEVSKFFYNGRIVAVDVVSGRYGLKNTRMVQFLLPGKTSGELLPGMKPGDDMVGQVSSAEALDMVADTSPEKEDELKEFICWWVGKTFRRVDWSNVELDKSGLSFERDGSSGKLVKIKYSGKGQDDFVVVYEAKSTEVAGTSLMPRVSYSKKGCPLVKDGELQFYTGVGQPLLIPEELLKPASLMEGGVKLSGGQYKSVFDLGITGDQLAMVIREYFKNRDTGQFQVFDRAGHFNPGSTLSHLVDPDDDLIAAIDHFVVSPAVGDKIPTLGEKAEIGRKVLADLIDYHSERGGVSSRTPPLITFMRAYGGRDCDILANVAASLYSRLGLKVALMFAEQDPKKVDPSDVRVGHVLVGLDPEEVKGFYDEKTAKILQNPDGRKWIVAEFGRPFGESVLLANPGEAFYDSDRSDYYVEYIEEVDPVRESGSVSAPLNLPVAEIGESSSPKKTDVFPAKAKSSYKKKSKTQVSPQ